KIHYARLQGAGRESGELRLIVEREIQSSKSRLGAELEEARANEAAARREIELAERAGRSLASKNAALNERLVSERAGNIAPRLEHQYRRDLWRSSFRWFAAAVLVTAAAIVVLDAALPQAGLDSQVQMVLAVAVPVLAVAGRLWTRLLPTYRERLQRVPDEARKRALEELKDEEGTL
ncbi:MAG TPA: hypothetical protein VGR27_07970, partial [Longimicrobiaceae bacterium]|nr:hypothetical protein [Longimicrobiaceae bacterium]